MCTNHIQLVGLVKQTGGSNKRENNETFFSLGMKNFIENKSGCF